VEARRVTTNCGTQLWYRNFGKLPAIYNLVWWI